VRFSPLVRVIAILSISLCAGCEWDVMPIVALPSFSPGAGNYTTAETVALSDAPPGAAIYYTTDGSTPTTGSPRYVGAISVSSSETIEAIGVAAGYGDSAVAIATYTLQSSPAATPVFSPSSGTYGVRYVSLSDSTPGATIYYTANGATPTTSDAVYSGVIFVSSSETIEAIAAAAGYPNSAVATATYTIVDSSSENNGWIWMGGSTTGDAAAVYGTMGTASVSNNPGTRYGASGLTDASGKLWLFGGLTQSLNNLSSGDLNDIWTFNTATREWTWVSGSNSIEPTGVYGTKGVASAGNAPPPRDSACVVTDRSGNFWMFGGNTNRYEEEGVYLNDVWEFNPASLQWTWVSGSNLPRQVGVYGTMGTAATSNTPGARAGAVCWSDRSGNLWIFGGVGMDVAALPAGPGVWLNDLWEFNTTTMEWT
jgi:hypothetical protein